MAKAIHIPSPTTATVNDTLNKRYVTDTEIANIHAPGSDNQDLSGLEPVFSKNTAFNKNFGTTVGTVTQGNDSRFLLFAIGINFTAVKTFTYRLGYSFKINTVDNPDALTTTIKVNGVAYTLGATIAQYATLTVEITTIGFIQLNCEMI